MPAPDRVAADKTAQSDEFATAPADLSVTAHRTTPGRYVFTEADNTDGWISSDTTVELRR